MCRNCQKVPGLTFDPKRGQNVIISKNTGKTTISFQRIIISFCRVGVHPIQVLNCFEQFIPWGVMGCQE